ncbi:MAG TPA: response regulator transcription factor [Spirillospora sp.]|jgi:two-component system, OmpR family, KDP operon response regulator KdpE|nr:response regulator transcription factor [Spirillospora sp.]
MVSTRTETRQILVVEDDENTAEMVLSLLETAGYSTSAVTSGSTALETIATSPPDLILLDLDLPDMDGMEVLRRVRDRSFMPMIVISGFNKEHNKVHALEAGADDYLGKPFSPEELVARIQALLRRVEWTPQPETRLVINQLELDIPHRQARIRGRKLHLTPVEYGLLITLMRRAGQVVSHDELLRSVWGEQYEGDYSVLRVNISRLRQKLEESPRRPAYILTVPGEGYRMPPGNP